MTFSIHRSTKKQAFDEQSRRYEDITTAEVLLETWGPGNFIASVGQAGSPWGIQLYGGAIYRVKNQMYLFHWSKDVIVDNTSPISLTTVKNVNRCCGHG